MSLSRNSTVLHSDLRQAQCVGNKCSPAFSVNTEISRDSGFSTDNSITFEKSVYIIAPPPPPPYVITTPKCPTLPIAKSQSMSSGYQSNETTPTNQYEVTKCHVSHHLSARLLTNISCYLFNTTSGYAKIK